MRIHVGTASGFEVNHNSNQLNWSFQGFLIYKWQVILGIMKLNPTSIYIIHKKKKTKKKDTKKIYTWKKVVLDSLVLMITAGRLPEVLSVVSLFHNWSSSSAINKLCTVNVSYRWSNSVLYGECKESIVNKNPYPPLLLRLPIETERGRVKSE